MKEKILAFLKTNAKLQGVQESYLLGVADHFSKTITEETQISATFSDGVLDLLKLNAGLLQSEGDKRATEASQTALKKYREKHGLDENGKPIEDPSKKKVNNPDPEEPAWFKAYREKSETELATLKTKLETQEKEKSTALLTSKVTEKLKEKGIPASYYKGRNLNIDSEDKIDQLIASVETDYNGFKQEMAEQGVVISIPPSGQGTVKEGEALGKKIAEKHNANTSDGVQGKKV